MANQKENIKRRILGAFEPYGFVETQGNWSDRNETPIPQDSFHYDNGLFAVTFFDGDRRFLILQHSVPVIESGTNALIGSTGLPEGPSVVYDGFIDLDDDYYVQKLMSSISVIMPNNEWG